MGKKFRNRKVVARKSALAPGSRNGIQVATVK
jgi:hypothetical protein